MAGETIVTYSESGITKVKATWHLTDLSVYYTIFQDLQITSDHFATRSAKFSSFRSHFPPRNTERNWKILRKKIGNGKEAPEKVSQ